MSERDRLVSTIAAAVIRESFDRMRHNTIGKSPLNALEHQISDHLAGDAAGHRNPRHHLSITGIEGEGDADALAVPAGDFEAVRGPSEVRARIVML